MKNTLSELKNNSQEINNTVHDTEKQKAAYQNSKKNPT